LILFREERIQSFSGVKDAARAKLRAESADFCQLVSERRSERSLVISGIAAFEDSNLCCVLAMRNPSERGD
jgi:hypothetical protein